MKFEEKLINLRKQKSMSQEELAEKLNVTRQTISKWELGQSKTDMDKLLEISKLFGISVDELTNDSINIGKEKVEPETTKVVKKERKYILYILIVILIAAVATLAIRIGQAREEEKKKQEDLFNNIFGTVTDIIQDQTQNDDILGDVTDNATLDGIKDIYDKQEEKVDSKIFNMGFNYAEGTKATIFVENILDKVVTSNKTHPDMLITVVHKNKSTTDSAEIKEIKKSLKEWGKYEVSVDYDAEGYVNKITIEE